MSFDGDLRTYAYQVIRPAMEQVGATLDQGPQARKLMFSVEYVHIMEFSLSLLDLMMKLQNAA